MAAGAVMQGIPVNLLDTAGVREAGDLVERLGVQRSRAAAQAADIVLMIYDATVGTSPLLCISTCYEHPLYALQLHINASNKRARLSLS